MYISVCPLCEKQYLCEDDSYITLSSNDSSVQIIEPESANPVRHVSIVLDSEPNSVRISTPEPVESAPTPFTPIQESEMHSVRTSTPVPQVQEAASNACASVSDFFYQTWKNGLQAEERNSCQVPSQRDEAVQVPTQIIEVPEAAAQMDQLPNQMPQMYQVPNQIYQVPAQGNQMYQLPNQMNQFIQINQIQQPGFLVNVQPQPNPEQQQLVYLNTGVCQTAVQNAQTVQYVYWPDGTQGVIPADWGFHMF